MAKKTEYYRVITQIEKIKLTEDGDEFVEWVDGREVLYITDKLSLAKASQYHAQRCQINY